MNGICAESGGAGTIVLFAVLVVAIIALFVWQSISSKKKQKKAEETVNSLKVGDRVKTIGGICGFVAEINNSENTFVLETGTNDKKSYVKFDKGAIYQTAPANGIDDKEEKKPEEVKTEKAEKVEKAETSEKAEEVPVTEKAAPKKKPAAKKTATKTTQKKKTESKNV